MTEQQETVGPSEKKRKMRRAIQGAVSLVAVVAVFYYALPQFANFSQVWDAVKGMSALQLVTLVAIAIWNIVTYWFVMVASLPGSNYWQAMKINQTSTAVSNSLPGGSAIGIGVTYAMYSAYGFSKSEIGLSVLLTGIWNNFVKLGMPLIALALLALGGGASPSLVAAALAGLGLLAGAIVLFALMLRSDRLAGKVGSGLGKAASRVRKAAGKSPLLGWREAAVRFRHDTVGLLRRRWAWLSLATVVSHVSLYLVLLVSLRFVGVTGSQVGWIEVLAAFSFIRLVSALPITPGGIGVIELGLTAALIAAGGPHAPVIAGVLVYRALTYVVPISFGLVAYAKWKKGSAARALRAEAKQAAHAAAEPR